MIKETPEVIETVVEQESVAKPAVAPVPAVSDEQLVAMLVDRARSEGLRLTGEGGLVQMLTKRVLKSALEGEITDHLGYEKHDVEGRNSGNSRNGTRAKTVLTDVGPVEVKVPRDLAGRFEPAIVKKRRRLTGVWGHLPLAGERGCCHCPRRGSRTGRSPRTWPRSTAAKLSKQAISTITDKVMEGMAEWSDRPLDRVYPVLFVDAINVKVRVLSTIL